MTTSTTAAANGSFSAVSAAPLSPDSFPDGANGAATGGNASAGNLFGNGAASGATAGDGPLDAADRVTLQTALNTLHEARADARSPDPAIAQAGKWQILTTVSHLTGFFDAKGYTNDAPPNDGFQTLFHSPEPPHLDLLLDRVESELNELLSDPATRGWKKTALNAAGDALISAGGTLIAAGIAVFVTPVPG